MDDDTPEAAGETTNNEEKEAKEIEEPEWRKERSQKTSEQPRSTSTGPEAAPVSRTMAYIVAALGIAAIGLLAKEAYTFATVGYNEGQVDIILIVRHVIDNVVKGMEVVMKRPDVRKTFGEMYVDDSMVSWSMFDKCVTVTITFVQAQSGARCCTVYADIQRTGNHYHLAHAYVDFVDGRHLDLVKTGIVKEEDFHLNIFDPRFSATEAQRQMVEQQRLAQEQEIQARAAQHAQQQQRR